MVGDTKKPNPVDAHVGSRVRLRRTMLGLSQEKLGDSLGITFQQVQKYEKGSNRMGASRLFQIARVLETPIAFFFEDLPETMKGTVSGFSEGDNPAYVIDFLSSNEGIQLNSCFAKIGDPVVRKRILELVKALSGEDA